MPVPEVKSWRPEYSDVSTEGAGNTDNTAVSLKIAAVSPPVVAETVFSPGSKPSWRVLEAMPEPSVMDVGDARTPPPTATAHVTTAPGTTLPNWSTTSARNGAPTREPT